MAIDRMSMLAKTKRRYIDVTIDGEEYRIQSLSDGERNKIELKQLDARGRRAVDKLHEVKAYWIIACLVDEDGNTIFSDSDAAAICNIDARITDALQDAILDHVGLSDVDRLNMVKKCTETKSDA